MGKNETRIIVYAKAGDQCRDVVNKIIAGVVQKEDIEVYGTISNLSERLSRPQWESCIAVLIISDEDDLERILTIRSLFDNIRVILVLPDSKTATIRIGHSLHPRYLSFKDSTLSDVTSVLAKMTETNDRNPAARC